MQTFFGRSRLSLAAGIALISVIGTSKFISASLYQTLHEWESVALCFIIPLAYLAFHKYNIS